MSPHTEDHGAVPVRQDHPHGEDRSSRRWIRKRIEQLDPVEDYGEIIRLSSVFLLDEFIGDWAAAQSMPRFATSPSAPAIYRNGKGKLMTSSGPRLHDTGNHSFVWAEFGAESPEAQRSIDMVNALHTKYEKVYPSAFDDPDLWVYVMAWMVCGISATLNRYLGFPLPDEKVRIATTIHGRKVAERFVDSKGTTVAEMMPKIDAYEDWVTCLNQYEGRVWEYSDEAAKCARAVLGHWEGRFPRPLRPFGRALVTSFWYEGLFIGNGVKPPNRALRWCARTYMKVVFAVSALRADSKESWAENQRRRSAETGEPVTHVLKVTQGVAARSGCPASYHCADAQPRST